MPRAYPLLWAVAVGLVSGTIGRWYLGFEWLGLAPDDHGVIPAGSVVLGLGIYFAWLWCASRSRGSQSASVPHRPENGDPSLPASGA